MFFFRRAILSSHIMNNWSYSVGPIWIPPRNDHQSFIQNSLFVVLDPKNLPVVLFDHEFNVKFYIK